MAQLDRSDPNGDVGRRGKVEERLDLVPHDRLVGHLPAQCRFSDDGVEDERIVRPLQHLLTGQPQLDEAFPLRRRVPRGEASVTASA